MELNPSDQGRERSPTAGELTMNTRRGFFTLINEKKIKFSSNIIKERYLVIHFS